MKTVPDDSDVTIQEVCFIGKEAGTYLESEEFKWSIRVAEVKNYARDLANGRANMLRIQTFIEEAERIQLVNPKVKIIKLVGKQLLEEGLNLHHAVGRGSDQEPAAVNLTFMNDHESADIHAVIGKGLVFDNGGLHVKPYGYMEDMYIDKGGASAALAAFRGVVEAGLKINITCSVGLAENSISATCYRPSDIIKSHNVGDFLMFRARR